MHRFLLFCLLALSATAPLASETFRNPRRIPISGDPVGISVADINNDGRPDLLYGLDGPPATINVQLGQPGGNFASAIVTPLPYSPSNCALLDVNSDQRLDLICPNGGPQPALLTLFGNGDGTFQTPITGYQPTLTQSPLQFKVLASADFNGDGKPDVLLNLPDITTVSVLLGDGSGHFTPKYTLPTGASVFDNSTIVDVNGDGKLDIVRSFGPDVLLGNGDGTFHPISGPTANPAIGDCNAKKDLDGDGHVDAVCRITSQTGFAIFHGNSDGSFNTASPLATVTVSNPHDLLQPAWIEDVNHDGQLDVLAWSNEGLLVFLGKPGLQFDAPAAYTIGYIEAFNLSRTILADADGNGILDVLTGGVNGIYLSAGRPDGTFDTAPAVLSGNGVSRLTVADFDKDGIADVVTSDPLGLNITLGKRNGSFAASSPIPSAPINLIYTAPFPLLHGDFDGDGNQDLVVQGTMSNNISPQGYFLHGNGDGTFATPVVIPYVVGGEPATIATSSRVADLNKDGRDDLISMDMYAAHTRMSLPGGGFSSTLASNIPSGEVPAGVFPPFAVGDFDGDGIPDVAAGLKNVYFLHGKGDGTFAVAGPAITVPQTSGLVTDIAAADFDQDGKLDLAVLEQTSGYPYPALVFVYYGNGNGTFTPPVTLPPLHYGLSAINLNDVNRDGRPDILVSCGNGCIVGPARISPINVFHSLANRTFSPPDTYTSGTLTSDTAVADVSGDGYPDILLASGTTSGNAFLPLINQPGSTVTGTVVATPEPSAVRQPFALTATLNPPNISTALSGTVSFSIDGNAAGSAPVVSNAASFNITTQLTQGAHRIFATWSGDTNYSSIFLSGFHTVTGYPVALPFISSANPIVFGQGFSLQYSLSNAPSVPAGIPQPSGTFSLTDNGSNLFPPTTVTNGLSGSAAFTLGLAPAGQHTLVASYSGDSIHEPASATIVENITPVSSTTIAQTSPNPSVHGQPVTVSATVTIPTGNSLGRLFPPPATTVTFTGLPGGPITTLAAYNSSASTSTTTVATATYRANALPAGTYSITAAYSGNVNSQVSASAPVTHIVQPAPTTTKLTTSFASAYQHQTITLSAAVSGVLATPTGSIRFLDGATPLASVPLASGAATLTASQLGVGVHSITAVYSGDSNNLASTSSAVTVTILPSDFTLTLDPTSISLVTGHHTTLHLTATSLGNFADTLHLSASNLPQWTSVQFTPADLNLTAGSTATTSVYIDTDAVIGYLSQARPHPSRKPGIPAGAAAALALILAPFTVRRRRRIASLLTLALATALLASTYGCSGKYPDSTTPGVYTLQITATGTQTGLTHTINLPLTVTK